MLIFGPGIPACTYLGYVHEDCPSIPDDDVSSIPEMCVNPSKTCLYYRESLESFNENGKFAKDNAVGFLTSYIDLNDPSNLCKCEKPFASFYAILDGFNDVTTKPCDLLIKK
eukprot:XP_016659472.1 PREDICTED: uncharacterized protein LOC107883628 isoform X2 [Acyrthosiphon pisum]